MQPNFIFMSEFSNLNESTVSVNHGARPQLVQPIVLEWQPNWSYLILKFELN